MHKKPFPLKLQGQTKSLNKMETLSYKTSRSQGKKQETLSYKTSCSQGKKTEKITKFYKFKAALKAVMMRRHGNAK